LTWTTSNSGWKATKVVVRKPLMKATPPAAVWFQLSRRIVDIVNVGQIIINTVGNVVVFTVGDVAILNIGISNIDLKRHSSKGAE
jgi:hypothetical protein